MNTSNRSPAVNEAKNEAPEIYSGKVGVEIVPDMRKLRSFAKDFIALVDSYWPETPGGVDEREQASQASWKTPCRNVRLMMDRYESSKHHQE